MDGQLDTRDGSSSQPGALLEISFYTNSSTSLLNYIHCFCDWGRRYSQVRFPAIQLSEVIEWAKLFEIKLALIRQIDLKINRLALSKYPKKLVD
jgi:hypothetical protein